jgi:hypothetical protein
MAKTYLLKDIPKDVFRIVQKEQGVVKEAKGTNSFSFESTIYKMIRDYDKCRKNNNFKPEPV